MLNTDLNCLNVLLMLTTDLHCLNVLLMLTRFTLT